MSFLRSPPSICLLVLLFASWARADATSSPVLEKDILPILQAKCLACHGEEKPKARLDLRSRAGMLKGGEHGAALVPGAADKSELWRKITADKMPPGDKRK